MEKMLIDFIRFNDNFLELYNKALSLGWEKICVVMDLKSFRKDIYKELPEKTFIGVELNVEEARNRKLITDLYYNKDTFVDFIFVKVNPDNKKEIRKISNFRFISGIMNLEFSRKKDHTHYRRSGIDHVIAKNLAKNEIAYVISISDIIEKKELWQVIFGRISQNTRFLKKYGFPIIIGSFARELEEIRSPYQVLSIANLFSINKEYFFKSIEILLEKIRKAKNPMVITRGFEVLRMDSEDCYEPY